MKINKWEVAQGASNLGEDDIRVAVLKVGSDGTYTGITKIAYCAYGGLKLLEVNGITDLAVEENPYGECGAVFLEDYLEGKDWEVGFNAKIPDFDDDVALLINDCEMFGVMGESGPNDEYAKEDRLEVISSEEYMADQYDELDIELLKIFNYN